MTKDELKRFVQVAQGKVPAELVLKNGQVFHSFTGEFLTADIAIESGRIAGIGSYAGRKEIDVSGRYVTPGFIDGHVHIESSMLSPLEFTRAVVPQGTTAVVTDPHEIANVAGLEGVFYMLRSDRQLPLDMYFMLPSCVPSTPLEDSGATLTAQDMAPLLEDPRVLGLAEMMNVPGVLLGDDGVYDKLTMAKRLHVEGHAPGLMGQALMGYAAAGVSSDHECLTREEGEARLRAGMYLEIREGSAAHNLQALLPLVNDRTAPFCLFVTDDRHPADLLREGHINYIVRQAVAAGMPAARAINMATVNAARYFGLRDLGVIAPRYRADLAVFDDLENWQPSMVFKDGRLAAEDGRMRLELPAVDASALKASVHLAPVRLSQLALPMAGVTANVIGLVPHQIVTKHLRMPVRTEAGCAVSDPENEILKLAVFERHQASGQVGVALMHGFGLRRGAIASTVAHDSHNLIVAGANDADMLLAVHEIERIQGGLAIVCDGQVLGSLPLPIGGLMSEQPAAEVASAVARLVDIARGLGVYECYDPFLTLAFLSLPVIPELKLTDRGLVDVNAFRFITIESEG